MGNQDKLVSIKDKYGNEYVCPLDAIKGKLKKKDELTDEELKKCFELEAVVYGSSGKTPLLDGE